MPMFIPLDRVSQTGVFKSATNSVEFATGAAVAGYRTFAAATTADAVADETPLTVLVYKDASNWRVTSGLWDEAANAITGLGGWTSAGSLANDDVVTVSIVSTTEGFLEDFTRHYHLYTMNSSGSAAVSLDWSMSGGVCLIGHSSTVTVTVDAVPLSDYGVFNCRVVNKGPASASIVSAGGADTVNGGSSVTLAAYAQATIYKFETGALVVV